MELKCMILNASPFGPKDKDGVGVNTAIQYIPLSPDNFKDTPKSKGVYISYCVLFDKTEKSIFKQLKKENFLTPCTIVLDSSNLKIAHIQEIKF